MRQGQFRAVALPGDDEQRLGLLLVDPPIAKPSVDGMLTAPAARLPVILFGEARVVVPLPMAVRELLGSRAIPFTKSSPLLALGVSCRLDFHCMDLSHQSAHGLMSGLQPFLAHPAPRLVSNCPATRFRAVSGCNGH